MKRFNLFFVTLVMLVTSTSLVSCDPPKICEIPQEDTTPPSVGLTLIQGEKRLEAKNDDVDIVDVGKRNTTYSLIATSEDTGCLRNLHVEIEGDFSAFEIYMLRSKAEKSRIILRQLLIGNQPKQLKNYSYLLI